MSKNKQSAEFERAKNLIIKDKIDFEKDSFCKELKNFLEGYFQLKTLTVDFVQGSKSQLVLCVTAEEIKNFRTLQ